MNVVGSVLTRRFNEGGDVVKVGRGIWGLKEWYPGRNFKTAKAGASEGERVDSPEGEHSDSVADDDIMTDLMERRREAGKAVF